MTEQLNSLIQEVKTLMSETSDEEIKQRLLSAFKYLMKARDLSEKID